MLFNIVIKQRIFYFKSVSYNQVCELLETQYCSPHVPPGPTHCTHGAVDTRHNVRSPARAIHWRLTGVVEIIPGQLRPQQEDWLVLGVPTRVRLADEEEQSAVEGLYDLVVRSIHLEQEHSRLATVRTGNDLWAGEMLEVKPGWPSSNLRGKVATLDLPVLKICLVESNIQRGRHNSF